MDSDSLPATLEAAPPMTLAEELTHQFYTWELRGRGWQVWPYPVDLEPPYRPFFYYLPDRTITDDGRIPSFWTRFAEWWGRLSQPTVAEPRASEDPIESDPALGFEEEPPSFVEYQVLLPESLRTSADAMRQFLFTLTYAPGPISFELLGTPEAVTLQFACEENFAPQLRLQLEAHFPEAVVQESAGAFRSRWLAQLGTGALAVDFGLAEEFCRPLRVADGLSIDPLIGPVAALSELQADELAQLQVLFQPVRHPWAESVFRAVATSDGKSFFVDAPEMVQQARRKLSSPLYAVVVRLGVITPTESRAWELARGIGGGLAQFDDPGSNRLIPLDDSEYDAGDHQLDLLRRTTHRGGMLLNADELVSLVHLPSDSVRTAKFQRLAKRTKAAPATVIGHDCVLGDNAHNGVEQEVSLSVEQRTQHMHVIGASGTGKSTLLLNMVVQDMEQGRGLAILDPHGDLIDDILARVPEHRLDDVVLVDPADAEYPVGFNILSAHSELEKNLLASDFVSIFRRLSTSWGDQMTTVLANAVLAFLESDRGGTLGDLRRFLVEKDFRKDFLQSVKDPEIVYYWQQEFPLLTGKPQGPILTRLDTFLRPKLIRYMVCQRENRLDFARFMDEGTIFLARLPQGLIGEENSYLLGSLLVSKFQQLSLARQEQQAGSRRPFFLYIDEFHNFICPSLAPLLTGARKYRLGLILAHQELRQLERRDSEVASAVLSNPYARVCFRVGNDDARKLTEGFGFFEAQDLQNLGRGEAICRVERADYDFNLRTRPVVEINEAEASIRRERILDSTRIHFARPRTEVETELAAMHKVSSFAEPKKQRKEEELRQESRKSDVAAATPPATEEVTVATPSDEPKAPDPPQSETDVAPVATPDEESKTQPAARETTQVKSEPPKRKKKPMPAAPTPMGKGGQQHRYLQQLIKRWAEGMGYKATIEKPLAGGASLDVALEKDTLSIACEISVTSTAEYETGNVAKCLDAGFDRVAVVTTERKKLNALKKAVENELTSDKMTRVTFCTPEELFQFVESLEAEAASREETIRGYKVNVNYTPVSDEEKQGRKRAVSKVVLDALKRMNKKRD